MFSNFVFIYLQSLHSAREMYIMFKEASLYQIKRFIMQKFELDVEICIIMQQTVGCFVELFNVSHQRYVTSEIAVCTINRSLQ